MAVLGLFGLSSYAVAQRTKEIDIRKVMGSDVPGILVLLSKDFLRLVLWASLIAVPIIWILMERWLDTFAFRIDVAPWPFLLAASTALLIAVLTIVPQSIRAATANPADVLRHE